MITPNHKTQGELIIDTWLYSQKLAKVLESIVLPSDKCFLLESNYANDSINNRLINSFKLRQRSCQTVAELTQVSLIDLKTVILSELQKSGENINVKIRDYFRGYVN